MRSARQLLQHLGLMREQIASGGCVYACCREGLRKEASMLEGSTISSMIYPTLRINYCLLLLIMGLQSPGPASSEPFPAYQTLPDTLYFFSFPALLRDRCYCGLPLGTTVGTSPRCCTPIKISLSIVVQTRTDVRVRIRGIVVRIRHRNTAIWFALLLPR